MPCQNTNNNMFIVRTILCKHIIMIKKNKLYYFFYDKYKYLYYTAMHR